MIWPQDTATREAAGASTVDRLAETLAALGWIDRTALLILLVFLVVGLFRGFVWQASRLLILVVSYLAAVLLGPTLAELCASWFSPEVPERLPLYVAWAMIFVAAMIVVSLLARLAQALVDRSGLSFANRVFGGLLGIATGSLVVMALLTGLYIANAGLGAGESIVQAAQRSRSQQISYGILRTASRLIPEDWRAVPDGWRELMRDPQLTVDGSGAEAGEQPDRVERDR